jgi:hypothetical protein
MQPALRRAMGDGFARIVCGFGLAGERVFSAGGCMKTRAGLVLNHCLCYLS